jgi:CRP/FNR family cyclic AMP-dependent transcriptional regulator
MSKSKTPPALKPIDVVDWTGVRLQRLEYEPAGTIFAQGDAAPSVMYVETGAVRLSVLSHAGKEAVVALLEVGHFFGEGCLAGQMQRMATRDVHARILVNAGVDPRFRRYVTQF